MAKITKFEANLIEQNHHQSTHSSSNFNLASRYDAIFDFSFDCIHAVRLAGLGLPEPGAECHELCQSRR